MQKIDFLAGWYLLLFGVYLPYLTIKSARRVRAGAPIPPRPKIWRTTLIMEGFLLFCALVTARAAHIDVFAAGRIQAGAVAATGAMLVVALVLQQVLWRRFTSDDLRHRLLLSRPHNAGEMGWWTLVSLAAGIVEEIAYRGVFPSLLAPAIERLTGASTEWTEPLAGNFTAAWWIAVAVCVAAFVLGHYGQGWARAAFLTAFAVGCHVLVRATGSLYPAMAFHVLYDLAAGLTAMRFARRLGPAGQPRSQSSSS